jgi:hypothetical protein
VVLHGLIGLLQVLSKDSLECYGHLSGWRAILSRLFSLVDSHCYISTGMHVSSFSVFSDEVVFYMKRVF